MGEPLYNATIVSRTDLTTGGGAFHQHDPQRGASESARGLVEWVLLHGASYAREFGYRQELLELSTANQLKYWGTVSRPGESGNWSGDVGRVESFFEPDRVPALEQRLGLAASGLMPIGS